MPLGVNLAVRGGGACLVCGNLPPVSGDASWNQKKAREYPRPEKTAPSFVLDLSHIDGQHAAEALECEHEEVEIILRQRTNNLQYLLVLQPKDGQTVPVLVEPTGLPEAAEEIIARSKDSGEAFGIVVAPPAEHITSLFASLTRPLAHRGE